MLELELVATEDLCKELYKRYDEVVIATSHRLTSDTQEYDVVFKASPMTAVGLLRFGIITIERDYYGTDSDGHLHLEDESGQ